MWSFLFVVLCSVAAGWMIYRYGLPSKMDSVKKGIFWFLVAIVVLSVISWILPLLIFLVGFALLALFVWILVDPKMRQAVLGKLK